MIYYAINLLATPKKRSEALALQAVPNIKVMQGA
jgi:hypothetical protein